MSQRKEIIRPLRVVHVEAGRHVFGGAQQVLYLLETLPRLAIQSVLVCATGSEVSVAARSRGLSVVGMKMGGDLDAALALRLAGHLRREGADLVHLHSRRGADTWGLLGAKLAGVPAVLSRRVDNPPGRVLGTLLKGAYRRVVCISDGIADVLRESGVGDERLTVIPSAVHAERFATPCSDDELRHRLGLPRDALVAGVVAQLIARKGHRYAFEALAQLRRSQPRLHLVCFGRGDQRPSLEALAHKLGLADFIHFAGFRDDMSSLLGALDMLVHPALAEGLGVALLEGAAAGCPLVASQVGGIPEIVRHGVTGRLVPPGDSPALAAAMAATLNERANARRMVSAARRLVAENHSVIAMSKANARVYQEVLTSALSAEKGR
ncbi:MAG: glycosyltransferase [Pseudomonadota bacterium]